MKLKITLNRPVPEIECLVEFATQGLDGRMIELHIKNSKYAWRGRAGYTAGDLIARLENPLAVIATVCVGLDRHFPMHIPSGGGLVAEDWKDALVWVAAHEAHHCAQFRGGLRVTEGAANQFARQRLEAYQKNHIWEAMTANQI